MPTRLRLLLAACCVFVVTASLQAQPGVTTKALPRGCSVYGGANYEADGALWCVVVERMKTGQGLSWGESKYVTSQAPDGYRLRWSEAHVSALDHHCGVKDEGDVQPSPFNSDHKRAGESFWA